MIGSIGSNADTSAMLERLSGMSRGARGSGGVGFEAMRQQLEAKGVDTSAMQEKFASAAGIDSGQLGDLRADLQSTLESTRASLDGSSDPRAMIESALRGVFEEHGVDVEGLKAQMQSTLHSAGGFNPASGFGGARPGSFGGGAFGVSNFDTSSNSQATTLLEMLENLPAGSVVDEEA